MTRTDEGSATVWVLAFVMLIVTVSVVGVARTEAVVARHRTERAADLAALACASRIGRGGQPCAVAVTVAALNRVTLRSCVTSIAPSGRSGTIDVVVQCRIVLPIAGSAAVTAHARAARLTPD
jgi:secretion/DNA translocation related TadE-like protein